LRLLRGRNRRRYKRRHHGERRCGFQQTHFLSSSGPCRLKPHGQGAQITATKGFSATLSQM
jgi:hypothetical protein